MPTPTDDHQDDSKLTLRISQAAGTVSVRAPRFPSKQNDGSAVRKDSGSGFRQKRRRVWHLVARRGLTLVTSFNGVSLIGDELKGAARRLRERHDRRYLEHCDYVMLADGYEPSTVHVFAFPYPDCDIDIVTTLIPQCHGDPHIRVLLDSDDLRRAVYDACEGLRQVRPGVDLHVMSRSGIDDVMEFDVDSVEDGLFIASQLISPHRLQVEQYQPFGKRPRVVGQFRPQIPIHEFKPRDV